MAGRLAGKRAIVIGVGRGMGVATAVRAADEGAAVVVTARSEERIEGVARLIEERGGTAHAIAADAAEPAQVARLAEAATTALGGVPDVLVNAVGAWRGAELLAEDPETVRAMLKGNLETIMTTTPAFARLMKERDDGRTGGAVVNIAAVFGPIVASVGQAAYNATKAGVVGYTRSAAAELLPHQIRVNCVMPGGTAHSFAPDRDVDAMRRLGKDKLGAPEDVAAAIVFLASDEASWITGAALAVDGGVSLGAA